MFRVQGMYTRGPFERSETDRDGTDVDEPTKDVLDTRVKAYVLSQKNPWSVG